jgi:hypothetical protein
MRSTSGSLTGSGMIAVATVLPRCEKSNTRTDRKHDDWQCQDVEFEGGHSRSLPRSHLPTRCRPTAAKRQSELTMNR